MKSSTIFFLIILAILVLFREPIKEKVFGNQAPNISAASNPVSIPTTTAPVYVQPTTASIPAPAPSTNNCAHPIKNEAGCKAMTIRATYAGMVGGEHRVEMASQMSILVYAEIGNYYMTLVAYDGHNLPMWVPTSDVYVSE